MNVFFFSSRRRHTRCALVTGVQTCALPIWRRAPLAASERTSDMKPRHDIYQTITAELAAAIDAGAGQWRMPWHHDGGTVMRPTSAVGRAYTGINRLVLWASAEEIGRAHV